ncbi:MAG TPA: hypothetical protein PLT70_10265 [bacterium]|nr:hypothetical protein [bacterium]
MKFKFNFLLIFSIVFFFFQDIFAMGNLSQKEIENIIKNKDYAAINEWIEKHRDDSNEYTAEKIWVPMAMIGIFDYKIIKSYFKNLKSEKDRLLMIKFILRSSLRESFSNLVSEGVITDDDFSSIYRYSDGELLFAETIYDMSLICMLGSYGNYDLVRKYIYKNKTPYSLCLLPCNYYETELHYAIIANDIQAVKYVLDNGYIEHIGLNFEKDLAKKHFEQWVYTEEQEKEDEEKPNPYKGKIIMENFIGEPRGFPIALALRGSTFKHEQMRIGDNLPSFEIIKLLIDKGARGISKKKAFELLEKTKSDRKPEEYEKIKQYLQKNYPDDKPLKKPAGN